VRIESLLVENYRSLEKVQVSGLGSYNVLIGKNNTGKSSLLNAVELMTRAVVGGSERAPSAGLITDDDVSRPFSVTVVGRPDREERQAFVSAIAAPSRVRSDIESVLLESPFAQQLEYSFSTEPRQTVSQAGQPGPFYLRQVRIMAADAAWATILAIGPNDRQFIQGRLIDLGSQRGNADRYERSPMH
jgi:hypothetical protein